MHIATKTNNTVAVNEYMFQFQSLSYPTTPQTSLRTLPSNPAHYACAKLSNVKYKF